MPFRFVVALILLVASCTMQLGAQTATKAQFLSSYHWNGSPPTFGGFSAIEVSDNGRSFVAITDRADVTRGQFTRTDGIITGITHNPLKKLPSETGTPLRGPWSDSEGLAVLKDGALIVSFEVRNRLMGFTSDVSKARNITPAPFPDTAYHPNATLEALAVDKDGTLFVIPEGDGAEKTPHPVYRLKQSASKWSKPFDIPRYRPYVPVGADIGPDGRFYLLERHLSGIFGFTSRVRRFDIGPDGFSNETILLESSVGQHDNLEGLSVWRDTDGRMRLTMVSDDNFKFFQVTEIVEYVVPNATD